MGIHLHLKIQHAFLVHIQELVNQAHFHLYTITNFAEEK